MVSGVIFLVVCSSVLSHGDVAGFRKPLCRSDALCRGDRFPLFKQIRLFPFEKEKYVESTQDHEK